MRVCVVGSGGREHALAEALARTASVVVTPGNPGMAALSGLSCVPGPPGSVEADLYVIGPEAPLVGGLADGLRASGKAVFGPGADGARLEGSKAWMKQVLAAAGVPTARYDTFTEPGPAASFLRSLPPPWVVKTDGLAAGKGVLVTDDLDLAIADVSAKLSGAAFGDAGRRVVVEEGLTGVEVSVQAVCDGQRAMALAPAQDFKRAYDGDTGPNTGGMGACSPVPFVSATVVEEVLDVAVRPTLAELRARGIDYRGALYAGLMLTADGPKVLEFNVRFGDPETQVVLPRWQGDVAAVLAAAAAGRLCDVAPPAVSSDAAVCVVLAAPGYPANPSVGARIDGLSAAAARDGVALYAAGVGPERPGGEAAKSGGTGPERPGGEAATSGMSGMTGPGLSTAGGRVLGVTGSGATIAEARQRAYRAVEDVGWPGIQYRRDIAAVAAEEELPR